MVASMAVLVVLAVLAALALTGRVVLPGISAKLFPIHYSAEISQAAAKYDQDPYLIAAMVRTESDFDPLATSGSGAVGLMQLMPATAEWVAEQSGAWPEGESPVLTDPVDSLELGVWYIDYLGGLYGKGTLAALAAYNAGLGNVDDWIAEAGDAFDVSDIPFQETRDYVERVERYKSLYERIHPDAFDSSGQ
jgi:soluble lytic murein transglycosylase